MSNMRKQGKKLSQKNLEATSVIFNDSMAEAMSESEFRVYIMKIIRQVDDEIREQMQALNCCTNQQLKKKMQETKDHFNKDIEILKKSNKIYEIKKTIKQIKSSIVSIINRLDQLEDRIPDIEDKVINLENKFVKQRSW